VFVVCLAAFELRGAIFVVLAGLLFDFGLAAKEHALRADDAGAPVVIERGQDVQDESIIAIRGRRRFEACAASEASERVFVALFAEDLLL
jgi:hypothetical protein